MTQPGSTKLAPGTVPAIAAMGLAVFLIANDITAMAVALPQIEKDFNTDIGTVQWVVTAYTLVFGVLIVTGGRFADMFGRQRILLLGGAFFGVFSLLGGLAPNVELLLVARALQGIGGALMWPAILGLIYAILPDDRANLAGGLIIGIAGIGNAAGPVLGGLLTQELSWRWILFLNVPITAVSCFITARAVPRDNPTERAKIDYPGIASITLGLFALLIALTEGPDVGWDDVLVIGLLTLSVVALTFFGWRELRAGDAALIPRDVISNSRFRNACLSTLLLSATFFASLLYLPQFLQKVLQVDALAAGAGLLPLMGTFALMSFLEGSIVKRIGARAVITLGAAGMAGGTFLLYALVRYSSGFGSLVPGMVVLGAGIGLFYSSLTTAAVTALKPSQSSLAGGILYMFQIGGGSIGLGVSTAVFLLGTNNGTSEQAADLGLKLTGSEQATVRGVLAGTDAASSLVSRYPAGLARQLTEVVRASFVSGLRWALFVNGFLALGGLVLAATKVVPRASERSDTGSG